MLFTGRIAATPELETHDETKLTRFPLIRNEYAGKSDAGECRERVVSVPFTAFGKLAEIIAANVLVGDQSTVRASIRNNHFTAKDGTERYDYSFGVADIEFGAPGPEKRRQLAGGAQPAMPDDASADDIPY